MTTFLLNSGHSIFTKGKRSKLIPPGILEYEFNADIVKRIANKAALKGIDTIWINTNPDKENMSLTEIVKRVNSLCFGNRDFVFISVHANAESTSFDWGGANGVAVFAAEAASEHSIRLAHILVRNVAKAAYFNNRGVKFRNFTVLKKTKCPAVLSENGFMTSDVDATKLSNDYWRDRIADAHVRSMLEFCEQ